MFSMGVIRERCGLATPPDLAVRSSAYPRAPEQRGIRGTPSAARLGNAGWATRNVEVGS